MSTGRTTPSPASATRTSDASLVILVVGQGLAPVGLSLFGPNPYPLAIVALALVSSAYIAEIFRSGIQSVGRGQMSACQALGGANGQGI